MYLYDLRCEHRVNPLGIDTLEPRFSWKIMSCKKGDRQIAYQLQAGLSFSKMKTAELDPDLWDSGIINSPESSLVPYDGKQLMVGQPVHWRVRVLTYEGWSKWSETSYFTVGLLSWEDWKGAYIGFPRWTGDPRCPLFRKSFHMTAVSSHNVNCDKPIFALLHVNSLGCHEVYVNGIQVDSGPLTPAVSQINKRSLSRTYDITDMLNRDSNEVCIWLGAGVWYKAGRLSYRHEGPIVRAQLEIWTGLSREITLLTDLSWETSESGYTNGNAMCFSGEQVHAVELPANMTVKELDKRKWHPVAIVDLPTHIVSPQMAEPNVFAAEFTTKLICCLEDGSYLLDAGKAVTGWTKVCFPPLIKGQKVSLAYTDHLTESGEFAYQGQNDSYVASGADNEVFMNKFHYHSYRYIKISGLSKPPLSVTAILIRTGYEEVATFVCSDSEMNDIFKLTHHTIKCLSLNGYIVDCSHLERLGYGGDGHASLLSAQMLFNMPSLYANWLNAWCDCICKNGDLPHTAPIPWPAGGGPYWQAFIIAAPWQCYQFYGDKRILEKCYPVMKKWLKYVDTYTVDGLLEKWPENDYHHWFLGDWASPSGVDQTNQDSVLLIANCVISQCYGMLIKISDTLGDVENKREFSMRRATLNMRIHETFFKDEQVEYGTGSQIDNTYPMLIDAVPPDILPAVKKRLFEITRTRYAGHLAVGLVGLPVLVEWATKNNLPDFIYGMLKKHGYPGYLHMINNGATAVWEHWNGKRSHIHNCYNSIGAWFIMAVGGIRPIEEFPGYRKVRIEPQIPSGVFWAKTEKETPYGRLSVSWEIKENELLLDINVPVGCEAEFFVPNSGGSSTPKITLVSGRHNFSIDAPNTT
jgi:alpha-L-rhamnosidase